jgi:DNA-3-methyladenine glycosylase
MYAAGGCAYVYFIYGMHYCVNVVTAEAGAPEAVLVRALEPCHGADLMRARRGASVPASALARGPGNLARALAIDRRMNGFDLSTSELRILRPHDPDAYPVRPRAIVRSPRIGVDYAGRWAAKPWRFSLRGNAFVSAPPRERARE